MGREQDDDVLPLGGVEDVQLLADVVGEGLDQVGVGGPPLDKAPLKAGRTLFEIMLGHGGHARTGSRTAVLWILAECHCSLNAIPENRNISFVNTNC